jgi:hypothetical protein
MGDEGGAHRHDQRQCAHQDEPARHTEYARNQRRDESDRRQDDE